MAGALFEAEPTDADHSGYKHLRSTEFRPEIRDWCEAVYPRVAGLLDEGFCDIFRRELPQRLSELFFAAAFLDAGWEPIDRVTGFDLAFRLGEGRLLVEITAPAPQEPDTYVTEERDGFTLWSTDASSEDAALRRLTGCFKSKADRVQKLVDSGAVTDKDYVVIAISGLRLNQETPLAPDIGGDLPDFAKAFLPIGSRYVTIQVGLGAKDEPIGGGYEFKATIEQEGKAPVDRNFFLRPEFQHIDAVAYTPFHVGGPGDGPPQPIRQSAVLHNPSAKRGKDPLKLGMGEEYRVHVDDDRFRLERV
jgi:hypothetical protein